MSHKHIDFRITRNFAGIKHPIIEVNHEPDGPFFLSINRGWAFGGWAEKAVSLGELKELHDSLGEVLARHYEGNEMIGEET